MMIDERRRRMIEVDGRASSVMGGRRRPGDDGRYFISLFFVSGLVHGGIREGHLLTTFHFYSSRTRQ
jgi:hypothetical protein